MKRLLHTSLLVFAGFLISAFVPWNRTNDSLVPEVKKPIYLNTAYSFEERAADLVSRLTLEEKQSLLGNSMAAVPRLGINVYNVWGEALHGVVPMFNPNAGAATSFPNSVALGSSWDPDLMERETSVIADEARAFNYTVISNLTYWSPVVEPVRDPRWGRTGESFGEDPFLISQIAGGFIRGLMGNDKTYLKAVPTAKHYFANNSEFNRHTGSSNMDERDMREFYLSPYKKLIERDNLPSIMTCYNAVNGIPVTASRYFVDTIARKLYGLRGYVTGDCGAVADIQTGHLYVKTSPEAAALALKATVDTDCGSVYQTSAIDALKQGLITEADIDLALVNMFTIRMRVGEFDPKSKVPYAHIQPNIVNSPGHQELAVEVATRTPVLLKNNIIAATGKKALPLNASALKKIALLGPQADRVELGPYSGRPLEENRVSPLSGIKKYLADNGSPAEVVSISGANTSNRSNLFYVADFELVKADGSATKYDATKFASSAQGIYVGRGMGNQNSVRGIKDGDWTSYNDVDITNADKINMNVTVPGDGGTIEVRLGSPTGNLLATIDAPNIRELGGAFGRSRTISAKVNQLGLSGNQTLFLVYKAVAITPVDKEILDMARTADVALVFVGTDDQTAGEEGDRLTLLLPGNQYELIEAVAKENPYTVVVIQSLGMVEVERFKNIPGVAGIIWTGFNGQAQGTAMAKILFGDVNPGGKLNATWFKSLSDIPEFTDYTLRGGQGKNGRTYWYFDKDVSWEFGYGLSYTTFEYSNFAIDKKNITPNDKIKISVDVKNTGDCDGDEVVQVYMKTPDSQASLQRPIKRLKGFRRVTIPAGQTRTVTIGIDCADLWFWDPDKDVITFDQGRYVFEIGSSSKDIRGQVEAVMSGSFKPELKTVMAECGKVVLKPGNSVQTSVTAAMTDDSFYDIRKAKVTYKSNNPSVASVDEKGLVTAKGVGTASIFAYVTVEGKTLCDSYPLKVMPNLNPSSIAVNGKTVAGFNPSTYAYSYLLSASAPVPKVTASPAGENVKVEIVQAGSVPGTAQVKLIDNITLETRNYLINFGVKSVSDEFKTTTPGKQWSWVRENSSNWSLSRTPGSLVITSQKGDIQGSGNDAANILLQSANTDWTIESKLVFSRKPAGFTQNGGLLAYQDDDNFVKVVYSAGGGGRRGGFGGFGGQSGSMLIVVEENGYTSTPASLSMADIIKDDNTLYIRFEKKGNRYTASCSVDGKKYTTIGSAETMLKDVKAGMIVCDGVPIQAGRMGNFPQMPGTQQQTQQTPFEVSYDYFRITNKGVK